MYCLIAAEEEAAHVIKEQLMCLYPDSEFKVRTSAEDLCRTSASRPDVLLLSRFLPGAKAVDLLQDIPVMFAAAHIVLLVGNLDDQCKRYIAAANKSGLYNIVTGDLPGDSPYDLITALFKDRNERLEVEAGEPAYSTYSAGQCEPGTGSGCCQKEKQYNETFVQDIPKGRPKIKRRGGTLILTSSNKGGVGKTTVAVSLAVTAARSGVPVVLADFDLGAPDIAAFFGIEEGYGMEVLNRRQFDSRHVEDLLVNKEKNLYILPGPMDKTTGYIEPSRIQQAIDALLELFPVVIGDTPPEFWTKEWLEPLFERADIVLAIVDQSKFSEIETRDYAPKLLLMGTEPDRIRIVCNRFKRDLHKIQEVERYFNQGLKHVKKPPRVIATIPEDWQQFVKKSYHGEIVEGEGVYNPWQALLEEAAQSADIPIAVKSPSKKAQPAKRGFFSFFRRGEKW